MKKQILFSLIFTVILSSCSVSHYIKRGNKLYDTGRYYKASEKYTKAFGKSKTPEQQAPIAIKTGQIYEDINKLTDAYNWYRRAIRADKENKDVLLKMAHLSIQRNNPEDAEEIYRQFDELFPEDERGRDGLYHLEILKEKAGQSGRYVVELQKELNSRANDFSPIYNPSDNSYVYFTSTRTSQKKNRKTDPVTGDGYSNIYVGEFTQEVRRKNKQGQLQVVRYYPEPRWMVPVPVSDSLVSKENDGTLTFNAEGTEMYFTSSRLVDGKHVGTRIYKASRQSGDNGSGNQAAQWNKLSLSGICGDSVSIGHPALTPDGSRLYFVTDMLSGGFGGKDIWYVENTDGGWGEPVNAGSIINTPGNEMYPYIRDNGELYFSSDGHGGFGGLDIYKIVMDGEEQILEHLPVPINSAADDFGIAFLAEKEEGLFTSSRSNRTDNIYRFNYIHQQLTLKVLVVNSHTGKGVSGVELLLVNDAEETLTIVTDSTGEAITPLAPDRGYVVTASHPDYLRMKEEISTYTEKGDRVYEVGMEMQPIEKPIVIPNIYFDVAKWDLREDAMHNLKELQTILNDNPNITIELSAHTDMVGNDAANMLLSERRANAVVDYLISQGVNWDRLVAKGYGKNRPRVITEREAQRYHFLKEGDLLDSRFISRLKGEQREEALQLNRRIEFRVLSTNYKPGPNSTFNPNRKAVSAGETDKIGETGLRELRNVKKPFYTLQLGVFKTVPRVITNFRIVFTEKMKDGTVRYCTGIYAKKEEAEAAAKELRKKGIECIVKYYEK